MRGEEEDREIRGEGDRKEKRRGERKRWEGEGVCFL